MIKEISIGLGLAATIFLLIVGYDLTPLIFITGALGLVYYMLKSRGAGVKKFNSKPAQKISFSEIGGQSSVVNEMKEALEFICNHEKIKHLGIRPLKGVLLTGPPGTGKTLLAKAAASYTDAAFISCSGSEFIEMYAGVGAQRVRHLFNSVKERALKEKKTNAVIFIDEIDILGGKRGQNGSHHEYDQTLNQLLVEMDGLKIDDKIRVLVIAATNRVDMLDPALLRPGRFDRQVTVDLPDKEGRREILKLHTSNKPVSKEVSLEQVARETFGFSGAHLESLTNEAAILAMREKSNEVGYRHFHEAIDKVMMGDKLDRKPSKDELYRIAVHETGHALMSEYFRPGSVSTLTVTPRGKALGYMRQTPENDNFLYTCQYLESQIAVMLAGALSEDMILGNRSTGASNDFNQAVQTAEQIISSGMSELGVISIDIIPSKTRYRVVNEIIKRQEERVKNHLKQKEKVLSKIVSLLMEEERISGENFRLFIKEEVA
ncbi:MAG: AAA family ATPase [Clostridiales bacterium]|nr:AAA family ATPase [Clostridiales bacterium]MCF8023409.1 AAA family ATPase [Clostridiales bacterium]